MTEKSREQKLRREAEKQGMYATKGKNEWGGTGWMIMGPNNLPLAGDRPVACCLSLEEAEKFVYGE